MDEALDEELEDIVGVVVQTIDELEFNDKELRDEIFQVVLLGRDEDDEGLEGTDGTDENLTT